MITVLINLNLPLHHSLKANTIIQLLLLFLILLAAYQVSRMRNNEKYILGLLPDNLDLTKKDGPGIKKPSAKSWIKKLQSKYRKLSKKEKELLEVVNRKQEELHQVTYFDILTQLPNRTKMTEEFEKRLNNHTECSKYGATEDIAIYILDIDRFRTINELYGRHAGDQVLIKVTERLRNLLGEEAIIARESEDEIFIMLDCGTEASCKETGRAIVDLFTQPFKVEESTFYVTASIGISRYPDNAQDMEALLQQAEIAMYKVKRSGKNNFHLFEASDAAAIERKRRIEFGLKEALVKNELYLAYQPKVIMETEEMYGVEALLRWEHPILGTVPPMEFIPVAEEAGIINEIGYWVIHEAVRQTKVWQEKNLFLHISVNVSALQLEDQYFGNKVKNVLELYDLDPSYFIVEITESVMTKGEQANRIIQELHGYGIKVAIDDFGTGYSSLSVLNNVLVDMVKIDKSFIDHIVSKSNTASLVKTMIQMGKSLDFKIVAEGIETIEQLDFLKENNCEYGQGYYFSKPVTPCEILNLSADNNAMKMI